MPDDASSEYDDQEAQHGDPDDREEATDPHRDPDRRSNGDPIGDAEATETAESTAPDSVPDPEAESDSDGPPADAGVDADADTGEDAGADADAGVAVDAAEGASGGTEDAQREPDAGVDADPESAGEPGADADPGSGTGTDAEEPASAASADDPMDPDVQLPPDVRSYDRFTKIDGAHYERVNDFLRERTYVTAREWAIARLCSDFRTETGVEMTKIGENLPYLVPFMTDTYTPQAVNQARSAFEDKVRKAGATFLYGAMCDFFTADELDDLMYEVTEVAKFLLEVEGVDLSVEEELDAEERISSVMREVRQSSEALRHEGVTCPHCGEAFDPDGEHGP